MSPHGILPILVIPNWTPMKWIYPFVPGYHQIHSPTHPKMKVNRIPMSSNLILPMRYFSGMWMRSSIPRRPQIIINSERKYSNCQNSQFPQMPKYSQQYTNTSPFFRSFSAALRSKDNAPSICGTYKRQTLRAADPPRVNGPTQRNIPKDIINLINFSSREKRLKSIFSIYSGIRN